MKKVVSLLLISLMTFGVFFIVGCDKTYNLNEYTYDEVYCIGNNGKKLNPLIEKIKTNDTVVFRGVITGTQTVYSENGKQFFYEITPVYSNSTVKNARNGNGPIRVLTPYSADIDNELGLYKYLDYGSIVYVEGFFVSKDDSIYHLNKDTNESILLSYVSSNSVKVEGNAFLGNN